MKVGFHWVDGSFGPSNETVDLLQTVEESID